MTNKRGENRGKIGGKWEKTEIKCDFFLPTALKCALLYINLGGGAILEWVPKKISALRAINYSFLFIFALGPKKSS